MQLGQRRVLHPGRLLWLRAVAWLVLLFFVTAAAFGLPLQAAVDLLPPGHAAAGVCRDFSSPAQPPSAATPSPSGWARAAGASELALRPALPGLIVGAVLGLLMMAVLMGVMVVTGLYDITLVGAASAWTGLGLALQAAVTEELWMRALLLRLLWRAFGPVPAFAVAAAGLRRLAPGQPGRHRARRRHRGRGRADVLRPLCADRAALGSDRAALRLEPRPGLPLRGGGLGQRPRRLDRRQHGPPGAPGWLTGGTFGPEASVFALVLVGSVTVVALVAGPEDRPLRCPIAGS